MINELPKLSLELLRIFHEEHEKVLATTDDSIILMTSYGVVEIKGIKKEKPHLTLVDAD